MLASKKISLALLEFAEPLISELHEGCSNTDLEGVLKIATCVWNACVVDQWHGNDSFVTVLRQQAATEPLLAILVEELIERKKSSFEGDRRGISEVQIINRNGERVVRAEARLDVQHMKVDAPNMH